MDGDTGHIKMTRVFRTSIITPLNKIKNSLLTPNGKTSKFKQKFYKKKWNMFALLDGISLHIYTLFRCLVHNLKSYKSF